MRSDEPAPAGEWTPATLAFSKQAIHFDDEDRSNPILQAWRRQVYAHVQAFLRPGDSVLELNAGTGIDAIYFAEHGYRVHATELSEGMVNELNRKIAAGGPSGVTSQQVSFQQLDQVHGNNFDLVFSNFGGLNCIRDLTQVSRHLTEKLKPGGYVTWVIMPPFCPWELLWLFKGRWREATRRFHKDGTQAHVEGRYFQAYYHSLSDVRKALGKSFSLKRAEGLGVFAPPPSATRFYKNHPRWSAFFQRIDRSLKDYYPFRNWGDHIIVTFQRI